MSSGSADCVPAFSVDPPGILVLTRHWEGDDDWLTVKRADPHVDFTDELLRDFANGGDNDGMYPNVRLEPNYAHNMAECRIDGQCFNGWLLHIDGRDRHVVYRIGEYVPRRNAWRATWPD